MKDVRCKSKSNYYETSIKVTGNIWKDIKQLTTFNCADKR